MTDTKTNTTSTPPVVEPATVVTPAQPLPAAKPVVEGPRRMGRRPTLVDDASSAAVEPRRRQFMPERTTRSTVTFMRPFSLRGVDGIRPPGTYAVETDEELILGLTFDAYRRTATFLFLPSLPRGAIATEIVNVDPAELKAALAGDAAMTAEAPHAVPTPS